MNSSDFRAEARKNLSGKWKSAVLITLAFTAISLVISFIQNNIPENLAGIVSLIVLIIEVPLSFGITLSLLKLYKNEDTSAFDFLSCGFSNFGKSWGITLRMILKMLLPFILLIVSVVLILSGLVSAFGSEILNSSNVDLSNYSGSVPVLVIVGVILYFVSLIWMIVRSYLYQLAYIVAADDENISSKEAIEKSETLMKGNRWKLFCLQLSFIGWAILAMFTLGIGYLWLAPYMQFALFAFYKFLDKKD